MDKFNNMNETEILNLAKDGDNEAISFIIQKYKYISIKLASEWTNSFIEPEDLMQEGMIGLLAAIKSYDESKKISFLSYAYTCVGNSIQTALRKVNRKKDFPKNSLVPFEKNLWTGKQIPSAPKILSLQRKAFQCYYSSLIKASQKWKTAC